MLAPYIDYQRLFRFVYICLEFFKIPKNLKRQSLDTCTGLSKTSQYLDLKKTEQISYFEFFKNLDEVIFRILENEKAKNKFAEFVKKRIVLSRNRENVAGFAFEENYENNFKKDMKTFSDFKKRYWKYREILDIFNIKNAK